MRTPIFIADFGSSALTAPWIRNSLPARVATSSAKVLER